jgi:hypothetical protein
LGSNFFFDFNKTKQGFNKMNADIGDAGDSYVFRLNMNLLLKIKPYLILLGS